jgi:small subunit ribosomal protein S13
LGTDLRRKRKADKEKLIKLGTIRGIRLRQGLPVRGQNTHSNARTARKKLNY